METYPDGQTLKMGKHCIQKGTHVHAYAHVRTMTPLPSPPITPAVASWLGVSPPVALLGPPTASPPASHSRWVPWQRGGKGRR